MGQTVFVNKQFWEAHNYMTSSLWDQLQCSMCQAACHTHCFILSCVDLRGVRVRRCLSLLILEPLGRSLIWTEGRNSEIIKRGYVFCLSVCFCVCEREYVCVCVCACVCLCLSVFQSIRRLRVTFFITYEV